MESRIAKKLRKEFEQRLVEQFPQFVRVKTCDIPPGDRLYQWEMGDGLTVYLFLALAPNRDEFTIEAAWSRKGRFPTYMLCLSPVDIPECDIVRDEPRDGEYRLRLPSLWPPHRDHWWKVSDRPDVEDMSLEELFDLDAALEAPSADVQDFVQERVAEVMELIAEYGIPYFQQVAEQRLGS